jgi:cytochrome c oxidase subunit 2
MRPILRRGLLLLLLIPTLLSAAPVASPQSKREITLDAKKYGFSPAKIEVEQGDVVRITLVAADIPHSVTIDEYRIAKRGEPGKPITFEFLADRAGSFKFYCNLTIDDGCKKMAGELVVNIRK